ncbi:hypothetical protein SDC9_172594 [bioreactor metagenome]|uniref:Uncharacterized protein n=1 Tax=bioreactor metagenome TaxID=1076179 RepID=A0A645GE54_9ZZZZ
MINADGDLAFDRLFFVDVDHFADDRARLELGNQLDCPLQCKLRIHGFHAFDEAACGIRRVLELSCRCADIAALEHGGLKQNRLRLLGDFGVQTAHYTRDTDAAALVRDQQHIRRDRTLALIQRGDDFAVFRVAHDDVAAVDAGEVKRMHRVAVFYEDIVCDVHDVIDRTKAD